MIFLFRLTAHQVTLWQTVNHICVLIAFHPLVHKLIGIRYGVVNVNDFLRCNPSGICTQLLWDVKKGKIKQFKYKNIWFLEIGSFLSTILSVSPRFPRNVKEICICQCINSRICVQTPSKRLKSTFVVTNVFKKSVFNAWKNIHEDPFYVTKRRQMLVQKFVNFFFFL